MARRRRSSRMLGHRLWRLEERIAPAVFTAFDRASGVLTVSCDAADAIVLATPTDGTFTVNGVPLVHANSVLLRSAEVTALTVQGSDFANTIDLSQVTQSFRSIGQKQKQWSPANFRVVIFGGAGDDTITGSNSDDLIYGGLGADVMTAGDGDDTFADPWSHLTSDVIVDGGSGDNSLVPGLVGGGVFTATINPETGIASFSWGASNPVTTVNVGSGLITGDEDCDGKTDDFDISDIRLRVQFPATILGGSVEIFDGSLVEVDFDGGSGGAGGPPATVDGWSFGATQQGSFSGGGGKGQGRIGKITVVGGAGDDSFHVDPGAMGVGVNGGEGLDNVTVNTSGLTFTQSASEVVVSGKAAVTLLNAETVAPSTVIEGDLGLHALSGLGVLADVVVPPGPFAPGELVTVTVQVVNTSPEPIESVSLNFTKIDYKRSSASSSADFKIEIGAAGLVDLASGDGSTAVDVTFSQPVIAPGTAMSLNFLARMPFDGSDLTIDGSLTLRAKGTHIKDAHIGRIAKGKHFDDVIIVRRSPAGQSPTLLETTAAGEPLFLMAGAGADPSVTVVTPGEHLYLSDFMIDVAADGITSGNGPVHQASVDFAGHVVAFTSSATNLLPGGQVDGNAAIDVFVGVLAGAADSQRSMRPVRIAAPGAEPNGASRNPRVTGDGRFVFFESLATNLDPSITDTNTDWDLFEYSVETGSVRCVSVTPAGTSTANKGVLTWDVSDDGNTISWITTATDAGSGGGGGGAGGALAVIRKKGGSNTKTNEIPIEAFSFGANNAGMRVAGGGSVVAIGTDAPLTTLLSKADTNNAFDWVVVDPETGKFGGATLNAAGTGTGNGASTMADLSFDGSLISFLTQATDLNAGPNPAGTSVAIRRVKAEMYCEDVRFQYSPSTTFQRMAGDGQSVAFNSKTDFRSSGAPDLSVRNLWLMDLRSPLISLSSRKSDGTPLKHEDCDDTDKYFRSDRMIFVTSESLDPDSDGDGLDDIYVSTAQVTLEFTSPGGGAVSITRSPTNDHIQIVDAATSAVLVSRPPTATRFVTVRGADMVADELRIDLAAGLTGMSTISFTGGAGVGDSVVLQKAPTASVGVFGTDDKSPVSIALGKVVEKATSGLKDTLKTQVRIAAGGVEDVIDQSDASEITFQVLSGALPGSGQPVSASVGSGGGAGKANMQDFTFTFTPSKSKRVIFQGSSGADTFILTGSGADAAQLVVVGAGGNDVISAAGLSSAVPVLIDGGAGDNTITGNGLSSTLVTGAGNDEVFAGPADVTEVVVSTRSIYALTIRGVDFGPLSFAGSDTSISLDLDSTAAQPIGGFGGSIKFDSRVSAVVGSPFSDAFTCDVITGVHRSVDGGGQTDGTTGDALTCDGGGVPTAVRRCGPGDSVPTMDCPLPFYFSQFDSGGGPAPGRVDFGGIESPLATNTGAPVSPPLVVNGGGAQRSRVAGLVIPFNFPAEIIGNPATALQITDKLGTPVPFDIELLRLGGLTTAYVTFTGPSLQAGSLADGRYTVTLPSASVVGGLPGGDLSTTFHRLFGDADGDATVTTADFLAFRLAFLSDDYAFDGDGSGQVTTTDFLAFRLNFLKSV